MKVENGLIRHSICDCGAQIWQDVESGRRSCEACSSYWKPDGDSLMQLGDTWMKASDIRKMFDSLCPKNIQGKRAQIRINLND